MKQAGNYKDQNYVRVAIQGRTPGDIQDVPSEELAEMNHRLLGKLVPPTSVHSREIVMAPPMDET